MRIRRSRTLPLALTNKGYLSIFPIGCGSAFSRKNHQNNYLIVKGGDHVMIDCGSRTPHALWELGHPVTDITSWLITHSHADHIGGLEELMLLSRYVTRSKPALHITEEYERSLWRDSLKGGCAPNERHGSRSLRFADFCESVRPTLLEGYPRDTRETNVGSINLKLVRTRHFPEQATSWSDSAYSVGLVIDDRVLFTGDTQFDPELLDSYDRIFSFETIFHDVQFFTGGIHSSIDELSTLPVDLKRRMLLMHYPDTWEAQVKRVRAEGFAGFVEPKVFYAFD